MNRPELVRLAIKHGVEDAPNAENELRYRRLEALMSEARAEQHDPCAAALMDADHLALCAEQLLAALNQVAGAEAGLGVAKLHGEPLEIDHWQSLLERVTELRSQCWSAVQTAANEYRNRAARARADRTNGRAGHAGAAPTPALSSLG